MSHRIKCFWSGQPIAERSALELLQLVAMAQDMEFSSWRDTWLVKHKSEQARKALEELSGGQLEIKVTN